MLQYVENHLGPVVALIAAFIAAATAFLVRRLNSVEAAHSKFREAFSQEVIALRGLRIKEVGEVYDLLRAAYPKHEFAYIEYSRRLGFIGRACLYKRWIQYRGEYPKCPQLAEEDAVYRLMHFIGNDCNGEERMREKAIQAIAQLIA